MTASPFTTDAYRVQFAWDSVSRDYILTCPRKYQLAIREAWQPKHRALPLDFGLAVHECMEVFYAAEATSGSKTAALLAAVRHALNYGGGRNPEGKFIPWAPRDPKGVRTRETLVRAVIWYHLHYWKDPAKTVILRNGKPATELSFQYDIGIKAPDGTPYILTGHLDRLLEFAGKVYVGDYKSTHSQVVPDFFSKYDMDDQMSGYDFASQVVWGTQAAGVMVDAIQLAVTFCRPQRGFAHRTPAQREEWIQDTIRWILLAEGYAKQEVDLGLTQWPMNRKSCHQYSGCMFLDVCNKDPAVRQSYLERDFVKRQWNPLEIR